MAFACTDRATREANCTPNREPFAFDDHEPRVVGFHPPPPAIRNPTYDHSPQVDKLAHGGERLERELHGDSISPVLSTGDNSSSSNNNLGASAD